MNSSKKKRIAIIYLSALGLVGVGIYPTLNCMSELRNDFNKVQSRDEAVLALKEKLDGQFPETNSAISNILTPICREREPLTDALPFLAFAGILAILGFIPILGKKGAEKDDPFQEEVRVPRTHVGRQHLNTQQIAAINVDGAFEIDIPDDERPPDDSGKNTLMALVEKQRKISSVGAENQKKTQSRNFTPSGFEESSTIFVDPEIRADTPTRFGDLEDAIIAAQKMMIGDPKGVQVRVLPGVYQCSIEIPPNVAVVNHRMPNFPSLRDGLLWVSTLELDDPQRVTILADPEKPYGVKFVRGSRHGIFGCHIIGRGKKGQCGILIERSESVDIVNCVIEQFAYSGLRIEEGGSEFPKLRVSIGGTMIRSNESNLGGAIFSRTSSVAIKSSVIKTNRAFQGGGLYISGVKRPFLLDAVRFEKNVAFDPKKQTLNPNISLQEWEKQRGMGGAIFAIKSKLKVSDLECIENLGEGAGGAIALLHSRMTMNNGAYKSRIERNRSQFGGGVFAVGVMGKESLLKAERTSFLSNICKGFGGAICVLGTAIVQAQECTIEKNQSLKGSGGGVACLLGGSIDLNGGSLSENLAKSAGGGIASLNGRVRIRGLAKITHNHCEGSGGGIFAISDPSPLVETLVKQGALKLPLKIIIEDAQIRYNKCDQVGAGLRLGNLKKQPTMPIDFRIAGKASIRSNESTKGTASDLFVSWAGEILSDDPTEYRKKLLS